MWRHSTEATIPGKMVHGKFYFSSLNMVLIIASICWLFICHSDERSQARGKPGDEDSINFGQLRLC